MSSAGQNPQSARARVLVVDDTAADRKLLRRKLEDEGFDVVEAGDGLDALAALRRERFDAVVSDILMPRLDGYRLCAEVRRDPGIKGLRYVLHTSSYTSPADEKLAYRFGVDAFLRKPAKARDLVDAIRGQSQRAQDVEKPVAETEQMETLQHYSDALVRKLEEKNVELEDTTRQLKVANREMAARAHELELARAELQRLNDELENRVRERTTQLEAANRELEQFSDAVAHDLRSPIRTLQGYGAILAAECTDGLSEECRHMIRRIPPAASKMSALVEDLMRLSRVNRASLRRERVDISAIARDVVFELQRSEPERVVAVTIAPGMVAQCDAALLTIALENLLSNAWKFTAQRPDAAIECGKISGAGSGFFVRDNGAGFDMKLAPQLFTAFNRLHSQDEFPGTGIGLATVKRIIDRHGGRIWAEAQVNRGATFFFSLP